jgi:foldase protein PrsA
MFGKNRENRRTRSNGSARVPLLVRTSLRNLLALSAFFVIAAMLAACGSSDDNSVPGNAVASVDGKAITKAEYEDWAEITARTATPRGDASVIIPDPPTFTRCIAELQEQSRPRRGQPEPSTVTLRAQCRQQNEQLVQQTMSALIQNAWIEGEAEEQNVTISDAEVQRALESTKRQSFASERAYDRFIRQSGMSEEEVLDRVRTQALAAKLTRKIQDSAAPVTDAQIQSFYQRSRAQFAVPERRDVQLVLTRSEAQANAAKSAVEGGTSWAAVARQYSTDAASKAAGGELKGVQQGQQDRAFDQAAFSARKGEIVGPVRGQFGWYLLRVTDITPARQTSLADAREQIRSVLVQQGAQQKMATFIRDFQEQWRNATKCRQGYIVPLCDNAPTPRTTSTAGGTVATPPADQGTTDAR